MAAVDVSYTDKCMASAIISMCKKPTSISQKKEKIEHHAFFFYMINEDLIYPKRDK